MLGMARGAPGTRRVRRYAPGAPPGCAGYASSKFRECALSMWNLDFCHKCLKMPVFVHNVNNYDGHLNTQNAEKLSKKNRRDSTGP